MQEPSTFLTGSFAALSVAVAIGFVGEVAWASARAGEPREQMWRRVRNAAAGITLWMAATGGVAAAGWLRFWPPPPTLFLLLVLAVGASIWLWRSALGSLLADHLPLAWLVGHQAFRILVELLLHRAHTEGLIGAQMTYLHLNFDVLTGLSGLILAFVLMARPLPRWLLLIWNWLGLALLVNIVTIAMLSAPTPFRLFVEGPPNLFVTQLPFVWLPAILVQAALIGHLILFRRLRSNPDVGH